MRWKHLSLPTLRPIYIIVVLVFFQSLFGYFSEKIHGQAEYCVTGRIRASDLKNNAIYLSLIGEIQKTRIDILTKGNPSFVAEGKKLQSVIDKTQKEESKTLFELQSQEKDVQRLCGEIEDNHLITLSLATLLGALLVILTFWIEKKSERGS